MMGNELKAVKDATPVEQAMHDLENELSNLVEISGKLESKLVGVMPERCPTPDKCQPTAPEPPRSALTNAIRQCAGRVRVVNVALADVLRSVEV